MKLGLILPLFSGDAARVVRVAREAERLGYEGVFVFDHFFPPEASPDRPALEAFSTLAAAAAATERVSVGTLVARASIRPPGLVAKLASWLDAASGGRLILGLGTGDPIDRPEHRTYGLHMLGKADRRAQLEEALMALTGLFQGRPYPGGRFVPPLEGPLLPSPHRAGGPPVWVGGQADEVVALAGRAADGWNGWGLEPDLFRAKARLLAEAAGERGRDAEATWAGIVLVAEDRAEVETLLRRRRERGLTGRLWAGTCEEFLELLDGLESAGATWAIPVLAGPPDRMDLVGERVIPALEGAVAD